MDTAHNDLRYTALRHNFAAYLKEQGEHSISTVKSDAFYLLRHDTSIDFMELLYSDDFERLAYLHLKEILSARSSARGQNIGSYMKSLRRLREFVLSDGEKSIFPVPSQVLKKSTAPIPRPSPDVLDRYLHKWNTIADFYQTDFALKVLFTQVCPYNRSLDEIIWKAATLNTVYHTNLSSVYTIARRILALNIDERLRCGDETLIRDITHMDRALYSFTAKYCGYHFPDAFPSYDYYIDAILWHYQKTEHFSDFKHRELEQEVDYPKLKHILSDFRRFFGLQAYSTKQMDQFLWLLGKEYFPDKKAKSPL